MIIGLLWEPLAKTSHLDDGSINPLWLAKNADNQGQRPSIDDEANTVKDNTAAYSSNIGTGIFSIGLLDVVKDIWTLTIKSQTIKEKTGVTITQGLITGKLTTAISSDTTRVFITAASGTTFVTTADIVIGSTTVVSANIVSVDASKISSTTKGSLIEPAPSTYFKDVYGNKIVGKKLIDAIVVATLETDAGLTHKPKLSGKTSENAFGSEIDQLSDGCTSEPYCEFKVGNVDGLVDFTGMVISGKPGGGPYNIHYTADFEIKLDLVGGKRRTVKSGDAKDKAWIDTCDADTYLNGVLCQKCILNSKKIQDTGTVETACACNAGFYSTIDTTTHSLGCSQCPLNSYLFQKNGPVETACLCNAGFYSKIDATAHTLGCSKCPGRSVSLKGSTQSSDCKCGLVEKDNKLVGTSKLYRQVGSQTVLDECKDCPMNSLNIKPFGPVTNACQCSENYYQKVNDINELECAKCPALSTSAQGSVGIDKCTCPKTHVRTVKDDITICLICPSGSTKDSVTGQCRLCKQGAYKVITGSSACTKCPQNTYNNKEGATAPSQCTPCPKERSTNGRIGNPSNSSCKCRRSDYYMNVLNNNNCDACPKGGDCSLNDNLEIQNVSGKPGFWHSSGNSTIFSDCRKAYFGVDADKMATDRCCPIDPLTNVSICMNLTLSSDTQLSLQCKKGYEGPMCKICSDSYVFVGGECKFCSGGHLFVTV